MRTRGFEVVTETKRKTIGEVTLPTRGTSHAMGYDFYANKDYEVQPNEIVKVWTDVKAYMDTGVGLIICIRSSMGGKYELANQIGIIDGDYYNNDNNDGNIGFFLRNVTDEAMHINRGDRIGQGIFVPYFTADNDYAVSDTRTGGFGSTGK